MKSFGDHLRSQRRLRGISAEDLSQITRVPLEIINALESDRSEDLPDEAIVKAHLRSIAMHLGIELDDLLDWWKESKGILIEDLSTKPSRSERITEYLQQRLIYLLLALSVLAASILFILLYKTPLGIRETPSSSAKSSDISRRRLNNDAPTPTAIKSIKEYTDKELLEMGIFHFLRIHALSEALIRLIIDDNKEIVRRLFPGQRVEYKGMERFELVIDNDNSVEIYYNNKLVELEAGYKMRRLIFENKGNSELLDVGERAK